MTINKESTPNPSSITEPLSALVRIEVMLVEMAKRDRERILAAPPPGSPDDDTYSPYNYKAPAYLLTHLYSLEHPDNPFHKQEWCADWAMEMADKWAESWQYNRSQGKRILSGEWPPYMTTVLLELIGDKVAGDRRDQWIDMLKAWCALSCERPFGFTAPNHEIFRVLALYRSGRLLERDEWCDTAVFLGHQLLATQAEEGFWEEGRHHGPAMKYNDVMLTGLARMYRLTGDEALGEAARRLARFMARWHYPDGITVGAFDGRQSTGVGFFTPVVPGLELVAEGRTLMRRMLELWRETGALRELRLFANSAWYAYFSMIWFVDGCRYFLSDLPEDQRAPSLQEDEALPLDAAGAQQHHGEAFDGLMQRQDDWITALSSQNSAIPRSSPNIFRLERESRIELWHRDARLVIGGGHNRLDVPVPYANVMLDTGFAGTTHFGAMPEESDKDRVDRCYYMPQKLASRVRDGVPELESNFAHGRVTFRFLFSDSSNCEIHASWSQRNVKRMALQLPLVVWDGARLLLDDEEQTASTARLIPFQKQARTVGGPFSSDVTLNVPEGVPVAARYPMDVLKGYKDILEPEPFDPPFTMALISSQWDDPPQEGEAVWRLRVGAAE